MVERSFKIAGYPLFDGLTRDDFRKSFAKMVGLVGKLHQARGADRCRHRWLGARAGPRATALSEAGLTNAEALQTATIIPARMTGMADKVGSIAVGKTADLILVEGDVSKNLGNLRHVVTVFEDGYRLDGQALRSASGMSECRNSG